MEMLTVGGWLIVGKKVGDLKGWMLLEGTLLTVG